jgi:hypothetical protein
MTDGRTRPATPDDIRRGHTLRSVDRNGYSYPFSDMVITAVYRDNGETYFDAARPHPGGVEHVKYIGANDISRYHAVLLASGKPATHHFGNFVAIYESDRDALPI